MENSVFLDTSFSIAAAISQDINHARALELTRWLEDSNLQIVTTQAIILEVGNALSKQRFRNAAVGIIEHLENDPNSTIIPISQELFDKAKNLFRDRADKEWGLVDCVSFVVMSERGISAALSADEHFVQAGFRALLREDSI